jgi:hypothetical protein
MIIEFNVDVIKASKITSSHLVSMHVLKLAKKFFHANCQVLAERFEDGTYIKIIRTRTF